MRKAEWQLVLFTIFVQMSVGVLFLAGLALIFFPDQFLIENRSPFITMLNYCLVLVIIAAIIALTHLSRPLRSIFVFSNIQRSWLSREALQGILFGVIVLFLRSRVISSPDMNLLDQIVMALGIMVGMSLIYTISRLYMLRTVPTWNNLFTPLAFYLSSILLGFLTLFTVLSSHNLIIHVGKLGNFTSLAPWIIFALVSLQMVGSLFSLNWKEKKETCTNKRVGLSRPDIRWMFVIRWVIVFLGLWALLMQQNNIIGSQAWILTPMLLIFTSEILGRFLFFWQSQRVGF